MIEAYSAEISDRWVRTTDLAYVDEDGFFFHQGRGDGVILRGGFKVSPDKIDQVLREHPAVLDAATVGLPDKRLGSVPAVAIELKQGVTPPTEKELEEHIRARLPAHHVPVRYLILDALPRTASLKPRLADIKTLFEDAPADA
jgi:acyl-coenzyme A synthetase/AMP-(fatty) acid ligase